MKKALIYIGSILGVLILLLIITPLLFKSKLVGIVQEQFVKQANATINFNPDIELSLIRSFPNLSLGIKDLSIVGVNEFEGDTLITWEKLSLSLDLMSVIKGEEIDVRSIYLNNPKIHALVLSNGMANWNILKTDSTQQTTTQDTTQSKFNLKLKRLEITEAIIEYDDKTSSTYSLINGFDYKMSGDFTHDEFLLSVISEIKELTIAYGGITYLNKVNLNIKSDLDMNMPQMKFTFKENQIGLNALKFNFDGYTQLKNENIEVDVKYNSPEATFKEFLSLIPGAYTKDFQDVKTSGKFEFNGFVKGTYTENNLPSFQFNLAVNNASFKYPSLPTEVKDIQIDLKVSNNDGSINNTKINLSKLHADLGGDIVDAGLIAENIMTDPLIDAWLKGRINLSNLNKFIPLETGTELKGILTSDVIAKGNVSAAQKQNFQAFTAAGEIAVQNMYVKTPQLLVPFQLYDAKLIFNPNKLNLAAFNANIGRSDIKLNGELTDFFPYLFSNQTISGKLNLQSNLLDVNEMMGISGSSSDNNETSEDTTSLIAPEIPSNINFTFTSKINELRYANYNIKNLGGQIMMANQSLNLNNIGLNMLGADFKLNGNYETINPLKPSTSIDFVINNLDIQQAFKTFNTVQKLAPIAENMAGTVSTSFKLNTQLDKHLNPNYDKLFAEGVLDINQAEITNVKLFKLVSETLKNPKYEKVGLSNTKIAFKVEQGRIHTQPFDIKIGGESMNIGGSTGIDQTIDYKGIIKISKNDLGFADKALQDAISKFNTELNANVKTSNYYDIELLFGGTFSKPTLKANLAALAKKETDALKDQALEALNAKKKELEDKAKAEAEKLKLKAQEEAQKAKAEADRLKQQAQEEAKRAKAEAERKIQEEKERQKKALEEEAKKKLKGIFKP